MDKILKNDRISDSVKPKIQGIFNIVFEFVKLVGKHASVSLDATEDGKLKICIVIDIEQVVK